MGVTKTGKRTIMCRHCRKRFVPKGRALVQYCPHCDCDTPRRRAKRSELLTLVDAIFSTLVRLRAADHASQVQCVTCDRRGHWRNFQAGHYMSRSHWATRYDWDNVAPQCQPCNYGQQQPRSRKWLAFGQWLEEHRGRGISLRLQEKAAQNVPPLKDIELIAAASLLLDQLFHQESTDFLYERHKAAMAEVECHLQKSLYVVDLAPQDNEILRRLDTSAI